MEVCRLYLIGSKKCEGCQLLCNKTTQQQPFNPQPEKLEQQLSQCRQQYADYQNLINYHTQQGQVSQVNELQKEQSIIGYRASFIYKKLMQLKRIYDL